MIRTSLLYLFVSILCVYSFRKPFVSLCGLLLLVSVIQHPDFPQSIGGIQGLNPWNILFAFTTVGWIANRKKQLAIWSMSGTLLVLIIGYILVMIIGVIRLLTKIEPYPEFTLIGVISEDVINRFKWIGLAILFYDSCYTRKRTKVALLCIYAVYIFISLQVIKHMPLRSALGGSNMAARASKILENDVGYNRVTLSMMLAGASWAILSSLQLCKNFRQKMFVLFAFGLVLIAQALTGGRTGYATWVVLGIFISLIRWPKYLILIPIAIIIIFASLPGVRDRILYGVNEDQGSIKQSSSLYEMTSGRNIAWPLVIDEIFNSPVYGYGKDAMITTGIRDKLLIQENESFPHPHQAYLEILLDNGIIGFLIIIGFFSCIMFRSVYLLLNKRDSLICVVGCTSFCLVSALVIGAFGGQTFYPREGNVGMWVSMLLALKTHYLYTHPQGTYGEIYLDDYYDEPMVEKTSY